MRQTHLLPRMLFILLLVLVLATLSFPQAKVANRISQAVDDQQITRLHGNVHPLLARATDGGRIAASTQLNRVTLAFKRTQAQQNDLDTLLQQQQDPTSANYHKWLTPEQFAQRFGITDTDLAKVSTWLQSHGFKIVDVARGRDYISFSGTAAQIASGFHTDLHQYKLNGETRYANATEPSIPSALAEVVGGIQSLNDFRPRPRVRKAKPNFTSSQSGNHFLAPEDFATIYNVKGLHNAGITGTGQKIAVVGQSDINLSDIRAFRTASGLPANDPVKILVPGSLNPGIVSGDVIESNLDLEWAGGVAKNAQILHVYSSNVFDSMQYAIDQSLAPVISMSYGDCEPNFSGNDINLIVAMAQKANAQGQTIVGPAGDDAATDCDYSTGSLPTTIALNGLQVDIPASLPYVTGIGGTSFNDANGNFWNANNTAGGGSALSYIPETGWNDTAVELANGGSITGTGGGASRLFTKPSWQSGTGVPNDGARDVPDISFNASVVHVGYLICSQGSCTNGFRDGSGNLFPVGGTSAGVPAFAGIVALINQQTASSQGNLNSKLYSLAASTPAAFHDVTSGDNKSPCRSGTRDCPSGGGSIGYIAGTGYDQVTGLGSIDATALAAVWSTAPAPAADFLARTDDAIVQLARGASRNVVVTVSPSNGFAGTVNVSCSVSSSLGATTCSVSPASINTSGTSTITIKATSVASAGHAAPLSNRGWMFESVFAFAFGLVLTGGKRRRTLTMIALLIVLIAVLAWTGCGGGNSSSGGGGGGGSTPLNGTVTVHMVSGTIVHDSHITVEID